MTVDIGKLPDVKESKLNRMFIHLLDLPWSAGFNDIREFFSGIPIPEGAIYIHGSNAFILFDSHDKAQVFLRDGGLIKGRKIFLTESSENSVRKMVFRLTRRKLEFTSLKSEVAAPSTNGNNLKKKMRPTPVERKSSRISILEALFCPPEIDFPGDAEARNHQEVGWHKVRRSFGRKRKIHPTQVSDIAEWNLKFIEAPEEFANTGVMHIKKMKPNPDGGSTGVITN